MRVGRQVYRNEEVTWTSIDCSQPLYLQMRKKKQAKCGSRIFLRRGAPLKNDVTDCEVHVKNFKNEYWYMKTKVSSWVGGGTLPLDLPLLRGGGWGLQAKWARKIYLCPHLLPSQVLHLVLMPSSLVILSARSTIEKKFEKIEGCEWSNLSSLITVHNHS